MGIIGIVNILVLLASIRLRKDSFEIMSIDETKIINGFFVFVIFLGHASQYVDICNSSVTNIYLLLDRQVGQLCVATFLLFSGYGVMESIKKKNNYINLMIRNRLLPIWITFVMSLVLYLTVNLALSIRYDFKTYVLSLFGIESIGNSNWYIFSILFMYGITYILGKIFDKNNKIAIVQIVVSVVFIIVLKYCFAFPARFYSTVLCYSAGLLYSLYKEKINQTICKHRIITILVIGILMLGVVMSGIRANELGYNIYAILFSMFIIWGLNLFTFKSKVLLFLGKHCFAIYLLQRLPMTILGNVLGKNTNEIMFILICIFITIIITIPFEKITSMVTDRIKAYK